MDSVMRFLPGRAWWAESRPVSPSMSSKQQILRGFPSRGIPFPKEREDIERCDVCPHPKPIKRGPLPGWLSYGTERRKEAAARRNAATANNGTTTTRGVSKKKPKKESKQTEEMDFYLRHDGHFKKPEKMRVVTYVKQYQRSDRELQASHQSDHGMDYGPNCDMKLLGHPTCGINCYQVRKNVYKASDELMSKQPEVVRIKPRPKEVLEMRELALLPGHKEATSSDCQNGNLEEEPKTYSNDRLFTTAEKKRLETSNQTNREPQADLEKAGSNNTPPAASSLPMEASDVHAAATLPQQAKADIAGSQNGSHPPNITNLLFPQPVLAAVPDGQAQSSYRKEVMQNVRERQREKHWQRERLNSAIIYQELAAKAKTIHDEGLVGSSRGGADQSRTRDKGKQMDEKMVRGKAQSVPEETVAEAKHGRQDFGGLQDLLKTAEEFERRDVDDHEREHQQQLPASGRSMSPTELEYMKAAILNHNFYPRLVSSFIDQHATGAPPETMAKLEQVRSKVMHSWNPTNSVECNEKIKRYQEILTKFESELEKPFQEAMELSFTLENMFTSPSEQGNSSRNRYMREQDIEGQEAMFS
ncbi:hypothetical protein R1sor_010930 [Riccia sorocarpa]|uniref:KNOX1 domain-containing protein n=1 Tax=Riccia sorocarpa TaxID=122646 RepID=A0ABD3I2W1_9MARC